MTAVIQVNIPQDGVALGFCLGAARALGDGDVAQKILRRDVGVASAVLGQIAQSGGVAGLA